MLIRNNQTPKTKRVNISTLPTEIPSPKWNQSYTSCRRHQSLAEEKECSILKIGLLRISKLAVLWGVESTPSIIQVRTCIPCEREEDQTHCSNQGTLQETDYQQRCDFSSAQVDLNPHPFESSKHPQDVRLLRRLAQDLSIA